ncbi:hypothetical protein GCM10023185_09630 [Hymenobacter saemangeumensis]|uniref:histidine kinase n=1 Tax=Hymenobacter saemangeumensis TaxID=1084522 RepID=A0ABP8I4H4_9BACT
MTALNGLAFQNIDTDPAAAKCWAREGLSAARRGSYRVGEANSLRVLGILAMTDDKHAEATGYFRQGLRLLANDTLTRAFQLRCSFLKYLGDIAHEQLDTTVARRYYEEAHTVLLERRPRLADLIGLEASWAGHLWERVDMGGPDTARYLRQSRAHSRRLIALAKDEPEYNASFLVYAHRLLAQSYLRQRQPDSARFYLQRLQTLIPEGDVNSQGDAWHLQAQLAAQEQRWPQAAALLRKALGSYRSSGKLKEQMDALTLLARAQAQLGDGPGAYTSQLAAYRLNNSIRAEERRSELAKVRASFEAERREARIRELTSERNGQLAEAARRRRELWTLGAVLLVVLAGLATTAVLALRLRRSRAALAAQNEELAQTRATQDRLYALVAHDLRSPVAAFQGLADLLTLYVSRQDTARLAGLGSRVQQAAEQLRGLLDNLLSWALQQRGELRATPAAVPVAPLLTDTLALYQAAAEAAGVTLQQAGIPAADLHLWADPHMTRTILRNLVGNALKVTPSGGSVSLGACPAPGGQLTLTVRDTGPGFGPDQLLRPAAPRTGTGLDRAGLGLRLSLDFAKAQGGQLALRNAADGGAVAELSLPLCQE